MGSKKGRKTSDKRGTYKKGKQREEKLLHVGLQRGEWLEAYRCNENAAQKVREGGRVFLCKERGERQRVRKIEKEIRR